LINTENLTLSFGTRVLFKDVNIKFTPGNCYGLIGANGTGKSTFLRLLVGDIEADRGTVTVTPGERVAMLRQDRHAFDEHSVLRTVIMGHPELYRVMSEREAIYAKEDFSEADGMQAALLEHTFAEMSGWEAEAQAATLLAGLGLPESLHDLRMEEIEDDRKVRVLLAQALFGNPDILLLDEPTNHLDLESIGWLEDFLYASTENTVIVVSHDRHFLNRVCTHTADIDFGRIRLYVGNYDFWYHASQLAAKQQRDERKKREDKISELKSFIQRFSSNASKARQATSRKKLIEKLTLDDIRPSSRRSPYIRFEPSRACGNNVLEIEGLSKRVDGQQLLDGLDLRVGRGDKIAFVGPDNLAKTTLFDILMGETEADAGGYEWGVTIQPGYYPKANAHFFDSDLNLIDWLRQYAPNQEEANIRGFLGRMLFSGEESEKKARVLSGGERVRCMLARLMQSGANALILDEPTNHLDLEAITALNDGLIAFPGVVLFCSHDHQFISTVANRIVEFCPGGIVDRKMGFDDYLADPAVRKLRDSLYHGHQPVMI
jgi:ATPase subunit of ABC transporter with duplicated ATPase domains